ncbi:unnamed protein product [Rangifer tarandus platyrhynchus]|uniref:Uncharacterized protein n=3 Tax=Rangifer tarandus platyrhynchus TaxID=3082113 RepID=A0ABN8ZE42_RANTA|nr:unnamed protein product [Rangifer tarandus platyrhynchus]CAI9705847.1 unnamed protein product [Rangifer tarandus platyrhynchus]
MKKHRLGKACALQVGRRGLLDRGRFSPSDEEKGLKNMSGASDHTRRKGKDLGKSILCGKNRESFPEEPPVIAALEWEGEQAEP